MSEKSFTLFSDINKVVAYKIFYQKVLMREVNIFSGSQEIACQSYVTAPTNSHSQFSMFMLF